MYMSLVPLIQTTAKVRKEEADQTLCMPSSNLHLNNTYASQPWVEKDDVPPGYFETMGTKITLLDEFHS
jgi:hypothetical protein